MKDEMREELMKDNVSLDNPKDFEIGEELNGCVAKDGEEVDGLEFQITTLRELIELITKHKEVHLNYFSGDKQNLDLWIMLGTTR